MVAGLIVSCVDPTLVGSATEVAMMVTLVGRPAATVGEVYVVGLVVVELNEPQGFECAYGVEHAAGVELLKPQFTVVLVVLLSVALTFEV